jgi:hypothetical protein|tara:strand:+ start:327 stop:620 length:294 start_codon:yes stop_codon:yes gene_type:complete
MEQDYSSHTVGYSAKGYPYTDIQTGLTYSSVEDKQRQLREHGLEETGWKEKGMSRSENTKHEAWKHEQTNAQRQQDIADNGSAWHISEEEAVSTAKM